MENDEPGTYLALQAQLDEILKPQIASHNGRLFKLMGDGVLAEFSSVVDAVNCALKIQELCKAHASNSDETQVIRWRIGVHLGDVISEKGDLHGDAVNVAARLESMAEPGSVCISRQVLDHIASNFTVEWHDLGACSVKNIERPIHVFSSTSTARGMVATGNKRRRPAGLLAAAVLAAAVVAGSALWQPWQAMRTDSADLAGVRLDASLPALAVMPFESLSQESEHEYLADGMTDDLITDLAQVSGLLVIARNSTFAYKNSSYDVVEISQELGARYIVSGSLRRAGERMRINAQLVDASSGVNVWAARYDGDSSDILALQDEVRSKIVAALKVKLTPAEERRLSRSLTESPEAYDTYLRARKQETKLTRESTDEAIRLYHQALEIDPGFVTAKARLAVAYTLAVETDWVADPAQTLAMARRLAREAISQDEDLPLAYWALARVYTRAEYFDGDQALANLSRALELDPNYADGHAFMANTLHLVGRVEDGVPHIEAAMRLNPRAPFWYYYILGATQYHRGYFEEAKESFVRSTEANPGWRPSRLYLVSTYGHLRQKSDAEWEMEELRLLGFEPTIENWREWSRFQDPAYDDRFYEGLRLAGVPEA